MNVRAAILKGISCADRQHLNLKSKQTLEYRGSVDVFSSIMRSQTALLFRPLDGLLGACLTQPAQGIIVSTKRPLSVQRFTAAHEFGHVAMRHDTSLDGEEILGLTASLKGEAEVEANAFASEFLIPSWLIKFHAARQRWDRKSLTDPKTVYQLSLRVGASYTATCYALSINKLVDANVSKDLLAVTPKRIKQELLEGYVPPNYFRDVWLVTDLDEGRLFEGQSDDIFLLRLKEDSGSGYLWNLEEFKESGFAVVRDVSLPFDESDCVGGPSQRVVIAQSEQSSLGTIHLSQSRPWETSESQIDEFQLKYDFRGKEQPGLPRAIREELMSANF